MFKKNEIALAVFLLSGCTIPNPNSLQVSAAPVSVSNRDAAFVTSALAEQTRDPEAARVRNLVGYSLSNGDRVVCGEFNGKNAYGGYVGYNEFYVRFRGNVLKASVFGEDQAANAKATCGNAAAGSLMIQPT